MVRFLDVYDPGALTFAQHCPFQRCHIDIEWTFRGGNKMAKAAKKKVVKKAAKSTAKKTAAKKKGK